MKTFCRHAEEIMKEANGILHKDKVAQTCSQQIFEVGFRICFLKLTQIYKYIIIYTLKYIQGPAENKTWDRNKDLLILVGQSSRVNLGRKKIV